MSAFNIKSTFSPSGDQPWAINELCKGIKRGDLYQVLLGVTGSGKTFTMANIIQKIKKPTLILSHNKTLAAQLYGEFKSLFPENAVEFFISYYDYYQPEAYLPVKDTFIEKDSSINEEIDRLRLKATTSLMSRNDVIIIASVSCIYGIGSPKEYKDMLVSCKIKQEIDAKRFMKSLIDIHYVRNDVVLEPGSFRMRGDIIEVFPIYEDSCIRIELFGDEVEAIKTFDVLTGKIVANLESAFIYPAKHFVTSEDNLNRSIEDIKDELFDRIRDLNSQGKLLEAQRLEQRTMFDLEMMSEIGYCSGIENYSRHLDGRRPGQRPSTLIDFFPKDFLLFIDESHVSIPQVKAMFNGDKSRKETLVEYGFRLPSALDNRPMTFNEFENAIGQTIFVSATPSEYELQKTSGAYIEQIIRPTGLLDPPVSFRKTVGQIDDIISEIKLNISKNERVLVTTLTKRMSEDLSDYLKDVGIKAEYLHSEIDSIERIKILRGLRMKKFDVLIGINLLREGLDLPEVSLVIVLDADKQGFLRSKSSLLQVAGRAARNVNGRVLLYGDTKTDAIKYLIEETNRRRELQGRYNLKNGITPETIKKSLDEIKSSTVVAEKNEEMEQEELQNEELNLENLSKAERNQTLEVLRKKMLNFAKELRFEDAAIIRDEMQKIEGIVNEEV